MVSRFRVVQTPNLDADASFLVAPPLQLLILHVERAWSHTWNLVTLLILLLNAFRILLLSS